MMKYKEGLPNNISEIDSNERKRKVKNRHPAREATFSHIITVSITSIILLATSSSSSSPPSSFWLPTSSSSPSASSFGYPFHHHHHPQYHPFGYPFSRHHHYHPLATPFRQPWVILPLPTNHPTVGNPGLDN
eukprot:TRINITY_DN12724_c0_g1_i1.p1 TRINITY_DN12724_c0_g1~~TRINITY_DN12724_c0_g1_i1.p1  ORF type:complete len:132 (+),score=19.98 TRINITY_DN12724_c0_g1_i1:362-757(+)